jgi:hypothetical protein
MKLIGIIKQWRQHVGIWAWLGVAGIFCNRSRSRPRCVLCSLSRIPKRLPPAEYLEQFIAPDLVHTIVDETDLYAQRKIAAGTTQNSAAVSSGGPFWWQRNCLELLILVYAAMERLVMSAPSRIETPTMSAHAGARVFADCKCCDANIPQNNANNTNLNCAVSWATFVKRWAVRWQCELCCSEEWRLLRCYAVWLL